MRFWIEVRSEKQNLLGLIKRSSAMDHNGENFASSWAAVLGHHPRSPDTSFTHHGLSMDLHVSQGFSYYRWIEWKQKQIAHR